MSQDDLAMAYRRGMEAYSRGDYEAAVVGFDPAIEWSVDASLVPDATIYHGHEGVKRFWQTWADAMSGITLEIEECRHVGPDRVLAITRAHGTGAGSGAHVASGRFAHIADFRDGRAVRVRLYGSVASALEAAGLSDYALSQENVELVRQGVARWRADDYDVLLDFLISNSAPDIELYSRFGGFSGEPYRGHDGLRAWLADIQENFERFDPWLDEASAAGDDRVVALGGIRFRARESGVDMAERLGWIFEFRNGQMRRMMFYGSPGEALEAAGLRE